MRDCLLRRFEEAESLWITQGIYTIGNHSNSSETGVILSGNISKSVMDMDDAENMFDELPTVFHESALIEHFHGFLKCWNIPRMNDDMKICGYDISYCTIVDELIKVPEKADMRDTAATTKPDAEALALMFELQEEFFANPSAAYKLSRLLKKILQESREMIVACINAEPREIIFTSGSTESDNWAIKAPVLANLPERPNIITTAIEHKSIPNSCVAMEWLGCTVTKLLFDKFGTINPADLRKMILPATKIILIMLANNEVGTIQPVEALDDIAVLQPANPKSIAESEVDIDVEFFFYMKSNCKNLRGGVSMNKLFQSLSQAETEDELKNFFAKFFHVKMSTKNFIRSSSRR